jgi:hypothetical protein
MVTPCRQGAGFTGVAAALLLGFAATGCDMTAHARLWADTALPDGAFSVQPRQWAYDGEPVTFELEVDPGLANFVVFGVGGEETVVSIAKVEGRFRWTQTFRAGGRPQTFEVYAVPYLLRGKCDWVFDKKDEKWYHYPGANEKPDLPTDREQRMKITCYRVEVRIGFAARGRTPGVELTLVRADGRRSTVRQRRAAEGDAPGFLLLGPDAKGLCEVTCVPRYDEVSRAGQTTAELLVQHADGSTERIRQDLQTP